MRTKCQILQPAFSSPASSCAPSTLLRPSLFQDSPASRTIAVITPEAAWTSIPSGGAVIGKADAVRRLAFGAGTHPNSRIPFVKVLDRH
jgi:hypothetical protein